jgi:hypothetical protein
VAKESVDEVALELVEKRTADICIDMAQQYERVVKLARPLGDRRVVDAVTDSRLFVDGATGSQAEGRPRVPGAALSVRSCQSSRKLSGRSLRRRRNRRRWGCRS